MANRPYWIYGKHSVLAALNNPAREIHKVVVSKDFNLPNLQNNVEVIVSENISKLANFGNNDNITHQGIAALVTPLTQPDLEDIVVDFNFNNRKLRTILLLDHVTDPHNVGAIIRSAAFFGVDGLILSEHDSPKENATIIKVASGGYEIVPSIYVKNLVRAIQDLKKQKFWICGLDLGAKETLRQCNLQRYENLVFVLGAEGKGIGRLVKENCDFFANIVGCLDVNSKCVDSLNVSNAAAVSLYERFCS